MPKTTILEFLKQKNKLNICGSQKTTNKLAEQLFKMSVKGISRKKPAEYQRKRRHFLKEYHPEIYEKHLEKTKEIDKRYYEKNKEKRNKYRVRKAKESYHNNVDYYLKIRESQKRKYWEKKLIKTLTIFLCSYLETIKKS